MSNNIYLILTLYIPPCELFPRGRIEQQLVLFCKDDEEDAVFSYHPEPECLERIEKLLPSYITDNAKVIGFHETDLTFTDCRKK